MKKISFLFVLVFFVLGTAQAQLPFHLGLKGGLNLNSLSGDDKSATATGLHVGPFANVQLGKLGVRGEVLLSRKGSETEFQWDAGTSVGGTASSLISLVGESKLWYVDVPVLLDYKLLDLKLVGIHLHMGPQFSFLLSDNFSFTETVSLSGIDTSNLEETFNYKSSDLGFVIGAGVNALKIDAGIRYVLGLSQVSDFQPNLGTLKSVDLKNRTFQVYVGFRLF